MTVVVDKDHNDPVLFGNHRVLSTTKTNDPLDLSNADCINTGVLPTGRKGPKSNLLPSACTDTVYRASPKPPGQLALRSFGICQDCIKSKGCVPQDELRLSQSSKEFERA